MEGYFKNHPGYKYEENLKHRLGISEKYKFDLLNYINQIREGNILEIGTGIGNFAYFCKEIGVKKYTGIDIDDYFFDLHKKEFKNYNFIKESFQIFLNLNKNYDVIFTSHLFEHLDEKERIEIVNFIYDGLKEGGIWINYMPNADSIISSTNGMFVDITHFRIYNDHSFNQLINYSGKNFSGITHINNNIGHSFIKKTIHSFFVLLSKIYYIGMGRNFPNIYTWEIISILKK